MQAQPLVIGLVFGMASAKPPILEMLARSLDIPIDTPTHPGIFAPASSRFAVVPWDLRAWLAKPWVLVAANYARLFLLYPGMWIGLTKAKGRH